MNICIVSTGYPPEDGGGIGTYTFNLAEGLQKRGHQVFIMTRSYGEDSQDGINGVKVLRFKCRYFPKLEKMFPNWAWSRFIAKQIEKLDREVGLDVIEFPNWEGVGLSYLKKRKRKPVVTRVHTPFFETLEIDRAGEKVSLGDRFTCWLEQKACQRSDKLISSTRRHRTMITQAYDIAEGDIDIIPLGIKIKDIDKNQVQENKTLKVLYVSRLEHRKGALTLMKAIPKVVEHFRHVEFIFIGKDRPHAPGGQMHKEYFEEHFADYTSNVMFLGFVSDEELAKHYQECDLFVVPSVYESFGLIYVEAMMYGKPVIGCDVGGVPEVIEDGQSGLLVEPNHVEELAKEIRILLTDTELRLEMGKKARKLCEEKFSSEIMAQNTEVFYDKLRSQYGQ